MVTKHVDNYNTKDLYNLFCQLYEEKHKKSYAGSGFIGNEFHVLKNALQEHGSIQLLCATVNCISNNDKTVTVPYFIAGLKHYLVPYNPYVYWAVKRDGTDEIKKLWKEFLFLDATWLPSASQRRRYKDVLSDLTEWAYAKTNKKKRVSNPKQSSKRNTPR
tara:strand:+ start:1275 stop:1757 length:483 start_codon:yes stop_codon:yes gene_type:complete